MHAHDDLNQLALDYLYGLLDGPDSATARAMLDTPEGQAALEDAKRFRIVLSAAAKLQFPEARFTPPSEVRNNGGNGNLRWVGWVVAATVLGAMAIPGTATYLQGRTLARRAELAQIVARDAQKQFAHGVEQWKSHVLAAGAAQMEATSKFSAVTNLYAADLDKAENAVAAKQFNVIVRGPAAITPGAPNYYHVETKKPGGQLAPAMLVARVVDQDKRVVYEPPAVDSDGAYTLKLPIDLPLKPDRELSLEIDATAKEGNKAELKQKLALAAPVYLSHLTTEKPLYQPGETVRFRALLLDRFKLEPPKEDLAMTLSVLDPSGAELVNLTGVSPRSEPLRGLAMGEYTLTESAAGGEYTVRMREATGRTPEQTRKFLVNKYQPARLEKKLEFTRKSYGPGDEVVATCNAAGVNGPLANQPVVASAQVDGVTIPVAYAKNTDTNGVVQVKFRLPAQIERGAASVTVTFSDSGVKESLVKPMPVVLKKLVVEFYPEGGDLIAGVPNRVYLQARTMLGKPAEMRGRVVDDKGQTVAEAETLSDDIEPGINQGQARFSFTPTAEAKYRLVVDRPEGITSDFLLPGAKPIGIVLNTGPGVTTDREPLMLTVANAGPSRTLVIGAYARGRLLDHQRVTLAPSQSQAVTMQPSPGFGGVTRVTVFEEMSGGPNRQLVPVAERLIFRQPSKKLELNFAADKAAYAPGENAGLRITARDETGKAIPAVVMLGVVNQSVVVMADEKSFRSMPTHFLLTGEVDRGEDLEQVDVLLGSHAKAAAALDLLLGVQGWRRFIEQGPELPPQRDRAEKIAVVAAPMVQVDSFQTAKKTVADEKRPELARVQSKLNTAKANLQSAMSAPPMVVEKNEQYRQAAVAAVRALIENYDFAANNREWLKSRLAYIGIIAGVAAIAAFGLGLIRRSSGWLPRSAIAFIAAAAAGIGWYTTLQHKDAPIVPSEASAPAKIALDDEISVVLADRDPSNYWGLTVNNNWKLFNPTNESLGKLVTGQALKDGELRTLLAATLNRGDANGDVLGRKAVVAMTPPGDSDRGAAKADDLRSSGNGAEYKKLPAANPAVVPTPEAAAAAPNAPSAPGVKNEKPVVAAPKPATDSVRGGAAAVTGGAGAAAARSDEKRAFGATKKPLPSADLQKPGYRDIEAANKPESGLVNKSVPELKMIREIDELRRRKNESQKAKSDASRTINTSPLMPEPTGSIPAIVEDREDEVMKKLRNQVDLMFPSFVVREYAHIHKSAPDGIRDDFTETVFWHPALIVPGEGLSVTFDLSDLVNRYQILAAAHTLDGRLGAVKSELIAR
jgi:MG2 domain